MPATPPPKPPAIPAGRWRLVRLPTPASWAAEHFHLATDPAPVPSGRWAFPAEILALSSPLNRMATVMSTRIGSWTSPCACTPTVACSACRAPR